jgi:hypothetical protein
MYQRFNPHWRRTTDWYKVKLWTEKKFLKANPLYPIFKLNETKNGYTGVRGLLESKKDSDTKLHNKIIRKYPDIMTVPIINGEVGENPIRSFADHPMYVFIHKHKKYLSEGFTDEKAFELTERDMSRVLRKEKFEKSVIEGLATSNRARSLMGHYEQLAEYEARQKIKQIQREEGRYKRYEEDLQQNLENIGNEKLIGLEFNRGQKDALTYEPATCKLIFFVFWFFF